MAHEISFERNAAGDFAYVGQPGWHGLGTELPEGAPFELWLKAAGMDYEIRRAPVQYAVEPGQIRNMPTREVFFRSDTGDALSVMGKGFKIVQPADVLHFFEDIVSGSSFSLETAGVLKGGARYFALAKYNGGAIFVDKRDEVRPYLLLATAVDGYLATVADFTTVRVVCQNTLDLSINQMRTAQAGEDEESTTGRVKVYHSTQFDAKSVKARLGLADFVFEQASEDFNKLAHVPMDDEAAVRYFLRVTNPALDAAALVKPKDKQSPAERQATLAVNKLLHAYREAPGAAPGTAWGALNAVTWMEDHGRKFRSDATRIDTSQLGAGAALKRRAYAEALAIAA